jgi:hypothetical protein
LLVLGRQVIDVKADVESSDIAVAGFVNRTAQRPLVLKQLDPRIAKVKECVSDTCLIETDGSCDVGAFTDTLKEGLESKSIAVKGE